MTVRNPLYAIDPMEQILRDGLSSAGVLFVEEEDPRALGLDFYLTEYDIHIEVKQYHSHRISNQMERVDNVIVIQGKQAARVFVEMIENKKMGRAAPQNTEIGAS